MFHKDFLISTYYPKLTFSAEIVDSCLNPGSQYDAGPCIALRWLRFRIRYYRCFGRKRSQCSLATAYITLVLCYVLFILHKKHASQRRRRQHLLGQRRRMRWKRLLETSRSRRQVIKQLLMYRYMCVHVRILYMYL